MSFYEARRQFIREYLAHAMQGRTVKQAAEHAGVNWKSFYKTLAKHGLEPPRTGRGHRGNWQ